MTVGGPGSSSRRHLGVDEYVTGVRSGDRAILARAITLVESQRADDMATAQEVLVRLLPETGSGTRVGISGVPGVGKSTFIDALGLLLIDQGHHVAVLAVDPSSSISGGSILGDKSRMPGLTSSSEAFIRPSPNALTPGGVGRRTRESLLLCEAAGFDVVLVETVGVGQSETMVAEMVDFFLVLLLAGAGDELQGIKKGILELADLLAVNKADGENRERALAAKRDYEAALSYLRTRSSVWEPTVMVVSGRTKSGLPELWQEVLRHRELLTVSGELETKHSEQGRSWMWTLIKERLLGSFLTDPRIEASLPELEKAVLEGAVTPTRAASELLEIFQGGGTNKTV